MIRKWRGKKLNKEMKPQIHFFVFFKFLSRWLLLTAWTCRCSFLDKIFGRVSHSLLLRAKREWQAQVSSWFCTRQDRSSVSWFLICCLNHYSRGTQPLSRSPPPRFGPFRAKLCEWLGTYTCVRSSICVSGGHGGLLFAQMELHTFMRVPATLT